MTLEDTFCFDSHLDSGRILSRAFLSSLHVVGVLLYLAQGSSYRYQRDYTLASMIVTNVILRSSRCNNDVDDGFNGCRCALP